MKHPLHRRRGMDLRTRTDPVMKPTRASWFTSNALAEMLHLEIVVMLAPGGTILRTSRRSFRISTGASLKGFPRLETNTTKELEVTNSSGGERTLKQNLDFSPQAIGLTQDTELTLEYVADMYSGGYSSSC